MPYICSVNKILAYFYLLLTLFVATPVDLWHDCVHDSSTHQQTSNQASADDDCDICDHTFAAFDFQPLHWTTTPQIIGLSVDVAKVDSPISTTHYFSTGRAPPVLV